MVSMNGETLSHKHLAELRASAISDNLIAERGYETITNPKALPPQFTGKQAALHCLLIPIRDVTGDIANFQLKSDNPRSDAKGRPIKYETAANGRMCIDVPASVQQYLRDPDVPLWITEGCKKVDSGLSHGISCIVGLLGVDGWSSCGMALPDWKEIALRGRRVLIAFDSDVMTKGSVRAALERLARWLEMQQAEVRYLVMPDLPNDGKGTEMAPPAKCGLDDWFASGKNLLDLDAYVVETMPGSEMEWEPPIPLDTLTGPEPPPDSFPETVQATIDAIATSTQTPTGLGVVVALGVLSAAARGRYEVYLPQHRYGEPAVLHLAAVMGPAERKTAVFNFLTDPLSAWANERRLLEAIPVAEWKSKYEVLDKRHAAAISAEANGPRKGKDGALAVNAATLERDRKNALQELQDHLKAVVYLTTLLADDVTNERLKELMVQNRGAIAIVADEGTFFEVMAGRFSDGARLETILNGHTGGKIDMQRRTGPPLFWPRGYLTIALAVQPHVIHAWGTTNGVVGKGAAARLMAVFPPSLVGGRDHDAQPVADNVLDAWAALVRKVLDYEPRRPEDSAGYPLPCRLALSTGAYALWRTHWEQVERNLRPFGAYSEIKEWAGKLHGATLRIAALLHIASEDEPDVFKISEITMRRAIDLSLWLADHAIIMHRVMASPTGQSEARQVLEVIQRLASDTGNLTRSDLRKAIRGRTAFAQARDLNAPLALLQEYGWIRITKLETGARPSEIIFLNPCQSIPEMPETLIEDSSEGITGIFGMDSREPQRNTPTPIRGEPLAPTGTGGYFEEEL